MQVHAVRSVIGYGIYKLVLSTVDWITASTALGMECMMPRAKLLIEMHNRLSLSDEKNWTEPLAGVGPPLRLHSKTLPFSQFALRVRFLP